MPPRTASVPAPAKRGGLLLLVGGTVLLVIAGFSAVLLRWLRRLLGQRYGGKTA